MTCKFSEQVMARFSAFMEKYEISNRELALEMGVSEARISQIFSDRSNITLGSVDRLYDALNAIGLRKILLPPVVLPL